MTDEEVHSVADKVLRELLGPYGYRQVLVRSGLDHDGDPALFLRAHFKPGSGSVGGKPSSVALSAALSAVHDALLERGDERFPYLRHYYPDDEYPEEDSPVEFRGLP